MEKIFDFSAPHFPNAKEKNQWAADGVDWDPGGHVNLERYFHFNEKLYFGRSDNAQNTKLYIDGGLVLEYASNNTGQVSAFGCAMQLPDPKHRGDTISISVEFDVVELKGNGASQIAVGAFATDADMSTGHVGADVLIAAATCQLRSTNKPTGLTQTFRLNAPDSDGGGAFDFLPFDFLSGDFVRPIPPAGNQDPWANHSSFPLELHMRLSDEPGSGDPPKEFITVNLEQAGPNLHRKFDPRVTPEHPDPTQHTIEFGTDPPPEDTSKYDHTLDKVRFAGVALNITHPPMVDDTLKGPARVRIRKLAVSYSDKARTN